MKKENAVIFGVTGVVFAAALIGGGIYMKTERDRNLNADTASTAADSNRAEELQKALQLPNALERIDCFDISGYGTWEIWNTETSM